jgi:hypothetical protein
MPLPRSHRSLGRAPSWSLLPWCVALPGLRRPSTVSRAASTSAARCRHPTPSGSCQADAPSPRARTLFPAHRALRPEGLCTFQPCASTRSPTASTPCSTARLQVCCTLLRSWGPPCFACQPPETSAEAGPGSSSRASRCGFPSTNSPRQQPYRITAAVAPTPFPHRAPLARHPPAPAPSRCEHLGRAMTTCGEPQAPGSVVETTTP